MLTKHFALDNDIVRHCKTVEILFLPDILSCSGHFVSTGPQLRGWGEKGGGGPLNKNSAPLKCPACPPKLPFSLRQFQDGVFFLETDRKLEDK